MKDSEQFPKRRFAIFLSLIFLLGLIIFEAIFLSQGYSTFVLKRYFQNANYLNVVIFSALTLISFGLATFFIWSSFVSNYKFRLIYFAVFCLAIIAEYGYQNAFLRFSNLEDVENAFVAADATIKLNAISMYFNWLAIIPCLVYGVFLFVIKPQTNKNWRYLLANLLLFVSFFSFTAYYTRNIFHTISLDATYRTLVSFPINWYFGSTNQAPLSLFYNAEREKIDYVSPNPPSNNIVFIVDESVRGDHLSLNGYQRKTTPFLEELSQKGLLKNWGIAVSGTTCSKTSNNLLLTGLNELPDTNFKIYQLPTIFQYAKAMGYKTYNFDGQVSQIWNGKPSDLATIDERFASTEFSSKKPYEIDAEIARRIKEITENSKGNFIWLNKYGVHKPYQNSYPNSDKIWSPTVNNDDFSSIYSKQINVEYLKNDYDNAILYNSQSFFKNLIGESLNANTTIVYTSDHGQTLMENGETVSHCSDTRNEANVPLFIISNSLSEVDTNFPASHSNLFATLLDLMNFPEDKRKFSYSVSLLKAKNADAKPRFYFYGDLHGRGQSGSNKFD